MLAELQQVLNYPHIKKYQINLLHAIDFIKSLSVFVILSYPIKRYIPEDKNDDYVIALALQTNSGFITSGDDHILSEKSKLEKKYKKLKIITKAGFEKSLCIEPAFKK